MENKDFLPLLISEPIYIINDVENKYEAVQEEAAPADSKVEEQAIVKEVSSPAFEISSEIALVLSKAISNDEKAFLEKILSAVKLQFTDVQILEKEQLVSLEEISFKKVIDFGSGIQSNQLQYSISSYQGADLLTADELSQIAEDQALKKKLWDGLKKMFEV